MNNNELKNLEDSFFVAYDLESKYLNEILQLELDKKIYYFKKHIEEKLVDLGLHLYESKGIVNKVNEWHALFICEKSYYEKVINILDTDSEEDPLKYTKFFDVIHSPHDYRLTNLYKNLIQSDFYNKELQSMLLVKLEEKIFNLLEIHKGLSITAAGIAHELGVNIEEVDLKLQILIKNKKIKSGYNDSRPYQPFKEVEYWI